MCAWMAEQGSEVASHTPLALIARTAHAPSWPWCLHALCDSETGGEEVLCSRRMPDEHLELTRFHHTVSGRVDNRALRDRQDEMNTSCLSRLEFNLLEGLEFLINPAHGSDQISNVELHSL